MKHIFKIGMNKSGPVPTSSSAWKKVGLTRFGFQSYCHPSGEIKSEYEVDEEFFTIYQKWLSTFVSYDGTISGMLADYIEENLPTNEFTMALITFLRSRFDNPAHNQK